MAGAGSGPTAIQLNVALSDRGALCWVFNSSFRKSWLESKNSVSRRVGNKKKLKLRYLFFPEAYSSPLCRQVPISDFPAPCSSFLN